MYSGLIISCLLFLTLFNIGFTTKDVDGYIVYCPCMGRFGNQIEQLLGSLGFAKALNRILVLPPFVEYQFGKSQATMVDFTRYFSIKPLENYHPVIPMNKFMADIAPKVWPKNKRKVFCWNPRKSIFSDTAPPGCQAKEGNPFGPFWDYSKINFVGDVYFGSQITGGFDTSFKDTRKQWEHKFPASKYPVLAFSSAPAAFPAKEKDRNAQRFLKWSHLVREKAKKFIDDVLTRPYVGIHLRNDLDWDHVCDNVIEGETTQLFGSAQCIGDYGEKGNLTKEMCSPSLATILDDVNAFRTAPDEPHVSLAILGLADHFIGNCVSTFSSFVYRERKYRNNPLPTTFFGFHPEKLRRRIEL
uniref:GDP-fucose protein O-fucosyltransferase 1 n=1 Tax=Syphacia muris TaxID=451379 RepID=A0A0N5AZJ3_9BILA